MTKKNLIKSFLDFFFLLLHSRRGAIRKNKTERRVKQNRTKQKGKTLITIEFVLQTNAIYFALGPYSSIVQLYVCLPW